MLRPKKYRTQRLLGLDSATTRRLPIVTFRLQTQELCLLSTRGSAIVLEQHNLLLPFQRVESIEAMHDLAV
jgi:hypothetical protein